jgi:phosphoglycolate phosphatase
MDSGLPQTRDVRLAVFDCDGTLVDSQHAIIAAMDAACSDHAISPPSPEETRRMVGLPLEEAIARLLVGSDTGTVAKVHGSFIQAFRAMRRQGEVREPLYPGALAALKGVAEGGWVLGMATGKSNRGLTATLEEHGIIDRFVTLQTADTAQGKPHPEMLENAMIAAGASPSGTVMIGDTTFDMEMARNAGTRAVGVAWGYHPEDELRDAGAQVVIRGFADLERALEVLMEAV